MTFNELFDFFHEGSPLDELVLWSYQKDYGLEDTDEVPREIIDKINAQYEEPRFMVRDNSITQVWEVES